MSWISKEIVLLAKNRGFSVVTDQILSQVPEINSYKVGILHLFIKHTSASLAINENADSTVLEDMESHFNVIVPERMEYYKHIFEGPDDMPAHIKASLLNSHISVPIKNGHLSLGQWQGIYLCEFRNNGPKRKIAATIYGQIVR